MQNLRWNSGIPAVKQIRYASELKTGRRRKNQKYRYYKSRDFMNCVYSLCYAVCFRRYTWLAVSCGAETVWVMGGVIDDGIAHNHPLLYTLLPISICLVLYLTASGRIGLNSVFISAANSLPEFRWRAKIWSVTSGIIVRLLAQIWMSIRYSAMSAVSITLTFTSFFLEYSYI